MIAVKSFSVFTGTPYLLLLIPFLATLTLLFFRSSSCCDFVITIVSILCNSKRCDSLSRGVACLILSPIPTGEQNRQFVNCRNNFLQRDDSFSTTSSSNLGICEPNSQGQHRKMYKSPRKSHQHFSIFKIAPSALY